MRWLLLLVLVLASPRPADACVQLQEANKLLGWAADGSAALAARVDKDGKVEHAEILPTRFEGAKHIILIEGKTILVKQVSVTKCDVLDAKTIARAKGPLTEASLLDLPIVKAMKLVALPADDGGASKLTAQFAPKKRYAEHTVEISDGTSLPVPVWCVGSCLRDEDWKNWGATVTHVASAGDRKLYVVRMKRVCNGGNDKDMWIDRVIAVPGTEKRPPRSRCRGSG